MSSNDPSAGPHRSGEVLKSDGQRGPVEGLEPEVERALLAVGRTGGQVAALGILVAVGFCALALLLRALLRSESTSPLALLGLSATTLLAVCLYLALDRWFEARLQRRTLELLRTLASKGRRDPREEPPEG